MIPLFIEGSEDFLVLLFRNADVNGLAFGKDVCVTWAEHLWKRAP